MVDWKQTLHELQGNSGLLRILNEAILEEAPRLMVVIRAAIAAHDASKIRLSAHTLKGAMRYYGDTWAYEEAFCLEKLACEGTFRDAADTFRRLDAAVGQLLTNVQDYLQNEIEMT